MKYLDKSFSIAMPRTGHWPWPDEPAEKTDEEPPEEKPEDKEPE